MHDGNDNKGEQLEKLLRLKRFEMPSEERWLEFDYAFENKRLSAIKGSKLREIFTSLGTIFNFKRIVCSSSFCLLLLIISLSFAKQQRNHNMQMAWEAGKKYVQFASGGMLVSDDDIDVQAGICNINYPLDGIEYVQDMLTMQNNPSLPVRTRN